MIAVFLADGFEEIEALAVVDILRRANLDVKTIAVDTLCLTAPTVSKWFAICSM